MEIQKSKETRRPVILEPVVSPHLSASERQALRWRCADRGIAALTLAVEGYDNVRRLEGDRREAGKLRSLRDHSAFLTLVGKMRTRRPTRWQSEQGGDLPTEPTHYGGSDNSGTSLAQRRT
jgi:hypothetical protein